MSKNQTVTEQNKTLLVETLRSIAEILIWGDQNDSTVFDFFLEKNMHSFFLKIMKQKCGSYVCVQLLQTLNILFENIRNETSLCKSIEKLKLSKCLASASGHFCFYCNQNFFCLSFCFSFRLSFIKQSCQLNNCSQI